MSILSQKQDVFEQVGVLKTASELSLNNITVQNSVFSSFASSKNKNKNDPFLFIVDLLTVLAGSVAVQKIITQSFASLGKIESSYKSSLKMEIQSSNGGINANPPMPAALANGMKVHINKLDFNKELMTQQNSKSYSLYIDDFKKSLINSIKSPGTTVQLNSMVKASYDNKTGFFTMYPVNSALSYNQFMAGMIDDVKFVDPKILYNQTLDGVFNTQKKTKSQIVTETKIDMILNNLMIQVEEDDSYYTFDTHDLNDIEAKIATADKLYTEVGCGRVAVSMTVDDVEKISSGISFPVSTKVIETALGQTSKLLTSDAQSPNLVQNDKQSVNNNFLSQFMSSLKSQMIRNFLASPQLNLIFALSQSFTPNLDNNFDPITDIVKRKALTKCMVKKVMNELLKNIFELVKKEILEVVAAVALLYAQEGIEKYKKILSSLKHL